jgi:carbon storage regulator
MLVLTRKVGEQIIINDNIVVTLLECRPGQVRLGFEAPPAVEILRSELRSDFRDADAPALVGAAVPAKG